MTAVAPDFSPADADRGLVPPSVACPNCGERRVTALDIDDETVTCCNCGTCYPFGADLHALPPATAETFAAAVAQSVATGEKVVAAIGRIAPHTRRRARGGK